jgi:hypothetical protein
MAGFRFRDVERSISTTKQLAGALVLISLATSERGKQNMLRFRGLYLWSVIQAYDLDRVSASATHKIDPEL